MMDGPTYRILLVEDERLLARAIARSLTSFGYEVAGTVGTGEEAIRIADAVRPDLVLMDVRLQDAMDGTVAAQKITSTLQIPVVFLTAYADEEVVQAACRAEPFGYVLKPYNERELRAVIEMAIYRSRAERERAQLRRLEALGQLAGGVAHDFNNVLTVILPACKALLERVTTGSAEHAQVTLIKAAADRAARMTGQLMTFGRRQQSNQMPCDLGAIVNGMMMIFVQLVGDAVALTTEIAPGLPCIPASAAEIEQLLLNLVANARDAIDDTGTIRIAIAGAGQHVRLSVADTGRGMDVATRARMFEPFFTTKATDDGVGIGLATVYSIVNRHRGTIEVTTAPGSGTTVSVLFPSVAIPAIAMPLHDPAETSIRLQGTALVVENDDVVRASLREILAASGMRVIEACDGLHAIEVSGAHPVIDVVVSDVVMPRMGAPELADRFLRTRPGIRFVYISGYPEGSVPGAHHGQLAHVLHKPFTPRELLERVRVALQS